MQRKFGIKRSFHCEDLSSISIVGLDQHDQVDDDALANSSHKRMKRQRTISTSSSSCSALCYCCEEEENLLPAEFMSSASSDDSMTPKASSSVARLISPATSHVAVTPELTPATPSNCLPCFPSLRARNESCDFPATAALERFMIKRRRSEQSLDDPDSDEESYHLWPKFDDQEGLPSPLQVEDFPWQTRRVSMASRKSSSASVQDSSNHGPSTPLTNQVQKISSSPRTASFNTAPVSFLSMVSSCKLPTKTIFRQTVPTVIQITEALSRM